MKRLAPIALVLVLGCGMAPMQLFKHLAPIVIEGIVASCAGAYAETEQAVGLDVEAVKEKFCSTEEQLRPFVEPYLSAQRAGAENAGLNREE